MFQVGIPPKFIKPGDITAYWLGRTSSVKRAKQVLCGLIGVIYTVCGEGGGEWVVGRPGEPVYYPVSSAPCVRTVEHPGYWKDVIMAHYSGTYPVPAVSLPPPHKGRSTLGATKKRRKKSEEKFANFLGEPAAKKHGILVWKKKSQ